MKRIQSLLAILSVLTLVSGAATAASTGVVYDWINLDVDPNIGNISGRIEFTDEVWLSGHFVFGVAPFAYSGEDVGTIGPNGSLFFDATTLGLIDFSLTVNGNDGSLHPRSCALFECPSSFASTDQFFTYSGQNPKRFSLTFGSVLSGSIAMRPPTFYWTGGGESIWNFSYNFDNGAATTYPCVGVACTGTGFWALDESTVPVPEPSTILMLFLGLPLIFVACVSRTKQQ